MTENALMVSESAPRPRALIAGGSKSEDSRLRRFADWQAGQGLAWWQPELEAWRDELLAAGLAPSSVAAYLATVKGSYRRALEDNAVRAELLSLVPDGTPADRLAMLHEVYARLQNATGPAAAPVHLVTIQDRADSEHLRLTAVQAGALLAAPGLDTLQGVRDTALIAVLLCTGLREGELVALEVEDLRQRLGGELAVLVRHGKGAKQRLVPYGDGDWCLPVIDAWCQQASIEAGPVFRSLNRYGQTARAGGLSTYSVQRVVGSYPVIVDGKKRRVKPHDLRRTYARLMFEAGAELEVIRQNLGHSNLTTTQGYIGALDGGRRRGRISIPFDFSRLYRQRRF